MCMNGVQWHCTVDGRLCVCVCMQCAYVCSFAIVNSSLFSTHSDERKTKIASESFGINKLVFEATYFVSFYFISFTHTRTHALRHSVCLAHLFVVSMDQMALHCRGKEWINASNLWLNIVKHIQMLWKKRKKRCAPTFINGTILFCHTYFIVFSPCGYVNICVWYMAFFSVHIWMLSPHCLTAD